MSRVYLAGPMRGIPEFNFPAFREAASVLRGCGFDVWSPAERDEAEGFNPKADEAKPLAYYMRFDLPAVCEADQVVVLPGWEQSQGARLEVHVARECGIPVLSYPSLDLIHASESVCEEADRLVSGDRRNAYGHPLDDFTKTAALWSAILGVHVAAEHIPLCMIAVKISRELNQPKRDNLVDICGYAKTLELVYDERTRRS